MPVATDQIDGFVGATAAALERAWEQGTRSGQSQAWTLSIAGRALRLRIAGEDLARRLVPALAHALVDDATHGVPVDLSIGCWDRAATGGQPPPPPWSADDHLPRGRIRGHAQHRVRITYDTWMRMLCVYDSEAGRAFVHVADTAEVPTWVDRSPLRSIFAWWAADRDLAFLHASAVSEDGHGVVVAGASGAGKSTTALACYADGMDLIGDDACIVDLHEDPEVFAVYGFAKLEPDALARLPALRGHVLRGDDQRGQILLDPGERHCARAALRATLLPQVVDDERSRLVPVSAREALLVLVPGSLLEGAGAGGSALRALTRLVQGVPCYRLDLGRDLRGVVECVRRATMIG